MSEQFQHTPSNITTDPNHHLFIKPNPFIFGFWNTWVVYVVFYWVSLLRSTHADVLFVRHSILLLANHSDQTAAWSSQMGGLGSGNPPPKCPKHSGIRYRNYFIIWPRYLRHPSWTNSPSLKNQQIEVLKNGCIECPDFCWHGIKPRSWQDIGRFDHRYRPWPCRFTRSNRIGYCRAWPGTGFDPGFPLEWGRFGTFFRGKITLVLWKCGDPMFLVKL